MDAVNDGIRSSVSQLVAFIRYYGAKLQLQLRSWVTNIAWLARTMNPPLNSKWTWWNRRTRSWMKWLSWWGVTGWRYAVDSRGQIFIFCLYSINCSHRPSMCNFELGVIYSMNLCYAPRSFMVDGSLTDTQKWDVHCLCNNSISHFSSLSA